MNNELIREAATKKFFNPPPLPRAQWPHFFGESFLSFTKKVIFFLVARPLTFICGFPNLYKNTYQNSLPCPPVERVRLNTPKNQIYKPDKDRRYQKNLTIRKCIENQTNKFTYRKTVNKTLFQKNKTKILYFILFSVKTYIPVVYVNI